MNPYSAKVIESYSSITRTLADEFSKKLKEEDKLNDVIKEKDKLIEELKEELQSKENELDCWIKDEQKLRKENQQLTTKLNKMIGLVSKFNKLLNDYEP